MIIVLFMLIVFAFNLIQVIGAFGGTMIAMPLTLLLFEAEEARLLLNAISILCCIYPIIRCRRKICIREIGIMVFWMLIGILIEQFLKEKIYSPEIMLCYSLMVILVGFSRFFRKKEIHFSKFCSDIMLIAAGIIHGAYLSGGALVAIYAMQRFEDKDELRGSMSVMWLLLNGFMLVSDISHGYYSWNLTKITLYGMLPAIIGILVGDFLLSKLDQKRFTLFSNSMLLLSGFLLMINNL